MRHISLFSGIGGPELAAEWCGWENISHTEWNPFGRKVLKYYWPNAKSHEDATKTDYTIYRGRADVLSAGFPCQGFSLAGKRLGTDDDRYHWPTVRRAYNECRPGVVVLENVTGLLSMEDKSGIWRDVFPKVEGGKIIRTLECDYYEKVYTRQAKMLIASILEDLENDGYRPQLFVLPAAGVGAPHKRERIIIVAFENSYGILNGRQETSWHDRINRNISTASEMDTAPIADSNSNGLHTGISENEEYAGEGREHAFGNAKYGARNGTTSDTRSQQLQKRLSERNPSHKTQKRTGIHNRTERYGNTVDASNATNTRVEGVQRERADGIYEPGNAPNPENIGCKRQCREKSEYTIPSRCFSTNPNSIRQRRKTYGIRKSRQLGKARGGNDWSNFPTQSPVCNGDDGFSARLDTETVFEGFTKPVSYSKWRNESIKSGGNAIVPQMMYQVFKTIDVVNRKIC